MKNVVKLLSIIICMFCFSINVFAATTPFVENGDNEDTYGLKNKYNSFSKTTVSSSNTSVTLYGKSECDGSKCTIMYSASKNSSFKDALARAVTCANGEKYISYMSQDSSGNVGFKEDNKEKLDGTAYWDEDYIVSCTDESSGTYVVTLSNDSSTSSTDTSTTTTTTVYEDDSSASYSSSSTVSNQQTGVNTYFIVLSIIAV